MSKQTDQKIAAALLQMAAIAAQQKVLDDAKAEASTVSKQTDQKIATALLDELWDAGFKLNGPECDKVDEIGRRIDGERGVLLGLLTDCAAVIRTIDPNDSDEAERLASLLGAIDRVQAPSHHQGVLL